MGWVVCYGFKKNILLLEFRVNRFFYLDGFFTELNKFWRDEMFYV